MRINSGISTYTTGPFKKQEAKESVSPNDSFTFGSGDGHSVLEGLLYRSLGGMAIGVGLGIASGLMMGQNLATTVACGAAGCLAGFVIGLASKAL